MAEKFNENTKLSPKELAKHLRQPDGEIGKKIGLEMNKGNKHICLNSYKVLAPSAGSHILEIGMGNGLFVPELLKRANDITYSGVDFSITMVDEANRINAELVSNGNVDFLQASIEELPFGDNAFDCITTTNTLYFWPNPKENVKELLRVLKPGGKLLIAYRSRELMDKIELSRYGFTKYDVGEVETLLIDAGFNSTKTDQIKEPDLEFDETVMEMIGFYTSGVK